MNLVALFAVGFMTVFFAAFQSRCVNSGQHLYATMNSFAIGIGQAYVWRVVTLDGAGWWEVFAYGASGALGVNVAMWLHRKTKGGK